jgi:NAD(P)-dependent dehydrogenase (short-subunit alcohol dehydrogenase family)
MSNSSVSATKDFSMAFELTGKNALITGGTAGIGLAVAKRFIAHGAQVVISGRRDEGEDIASGIGALFIKSDLTDDLDIHCLFGQALSQLGDLHIVVNNAGCSLPESVIAEQDMVNFDQTFNLNFRAAYQVLQQAARHVSPGGSIINTASVAAMSGGAGGSAYYATKAAMVNLTKTAALELACKNIRVNVVSPGLIESEIWNDNLPHDWARAAVPLQRVGLGDEAAAVFHFLAADDSSYVTGANYLVDGGYCAGAVKR